MAKLKKFKLKDIKGLLGKKLLLLGKNAFLAFWGLFILSLILTGFVFYSYHAFTKEPDIETLEKQFQFKTKTYQEILGIWQEKQKKLNQTDSKIYPDPFVP